MIYNILYVPYHDYGDLKYSEGYLFSINDRLEVLSVELVLVYYIVFSKGFKCYNGGRGMSMVLNNLSYNDGGKCEFLKVCNLNVKVIDITHYEDSPLRNDPIFNISPYDSFSNSKFNILQKYLPRRYHFKLYDMRNAVIIEDDTFTI